MRWGTWLPSLPFILIASSVCVHVWARLLSIHNEWSLGGSSHTAKIFPTLFFYQFYYAVRNVHFPWSPAVFKLQVVRRMGFWNDAHILRASISSFNEYEFQFSHSHASWMSLYHASNVIVTLIMIFACSFLNKVKCNVQFKLNKMLHAVSLKVFFFYSEVTFIFPKFHLLSEVLVFTHCTQTVPAALFS